MTLPAAGWYPDPQDPTGLRWWDGVRWGAPAPRTTPVVAPTATWESTPRPPAPSEYRWTVDEPVLSGRKARVARDRATRAMNPFGYAGLVLALIAFLVNLLAIPSILAIIFGAIGLARAGQLTGQRVTGFGTSLAAVILGLVTGAWFFAGLVQLVG